MRTDFFHLLIYLCNIYTYMQYSACVHKVKGKELQEGNREGGRRKANLHVTLFTLLSALTKHGSKKRGGGKREKESEREERGEERKEGGAGRTI